MHVSYKYFTQLRFNTVIQLFTYFAVFCWKIELLNGQIHSNKLAVNELYPSGTILTFSCDTGYVLDTSMGGSRKSTYCLSDGNWSYYPPKCKLGTWLGLNSNRFQ